MLSKKDKQGLALMAAAGAVLVALFFVRIHWDAQPKAGADNCVGEVTRNTVVVLDHSDRITDQTLEEIAARAMAHIRDSVAVNERVSLFTISDLSKRSLKPLLSLCRPPNDGNRLVEDVARIKKKFHTNFELPIRAALRVPPGTSKESPIAQALTDISLSEYLRGGLNKLVVFSDMLENTDKFSLYKCQSSEDVIAQYRSSRRGAMERPSFTNTVVMVNLIPRLDQSRETLGCRDKFWPWFFGDGAGPHAKVTFDYLPGGVSMGQAPAGASN